MPEMLTCPQGHEWDYQSLLSQLLCPMCGAAALTQNRPSSDSPIPTTRGDASVASPPTPTSGSSAAYPNADVSRLMLPDPKFDNVRWGYTAGNPEPRWILIDP
jgi:hypothetical protein